MEPGFMRKNLLWIIILVMAVGVIMRLTLREKPVSEKEKIIKNEAHDKSRTERESFRLEKFKMNTLNRMPGNSDLIDFGDEDSGAAKIVIDLEQEAVAEDEIDTTSPNVYVFEVDSNGKLMLNEKTMLAIERLYLMNSADELKEKLEQFSDILLPNAHSEVVNLIDDFEKYSFDVNQISKYEFTPETAEEALSYLQELHDLRVQHFGEDAARAMFEKQETMNREMLELIYTEKNSDM